MNQDNNNWLNVYLKQKQCLWELILLLNTFTNSYSDLFCECLYCT